MVTSQFLTINFSTGLYIMSPIITKAIEALCSKQANREKLKTEIHLEWANLKSDKC